MQRLGQGSVATSLIDSGFRRLAYAAYAGAIVVIVTVSLLGSDKNHGSASGAPPIDVPESAADGIDPRSSAPQSAGSFPGPSNNSADASTLANLTSVVTTKPNPGLVDENGVASATIFPSGDQTGLGQNAVWAPAGSVVTISCSVSDQNWDQVIGPECVFGILSQPGNDAILTHGRDGTEFASPRVNLFTGTTQGPIIVIGSAYGVSDQAIVNVYTGEHPPPVEDMLNDD